MTECEKRAVKEQTTTRAARALLVLRNDDGSVDKRMRDVVGFLAEAGAKRDAAVRGRPRHVCEVAESFWNGYYFYELRHKTSTGIYS